MKTKKIITSVCTAAVFASLICMPAYAASGDVAGAIEGTWQTASQQIKTVVDHVVFPAIDLILAVFFFGKLGTAYFDYRKHGQFEWAAPAILFACLVFTLTAPLYIWQILGIESDTGLDAIGLIRNHLPEQGDVKLQQMIDWLRADSWNAPPEVSEGVSHTSPMAVAELIVKFQEKDFSALDGIRGDKKFSSLSSFTASKESLQWVREYLSETLFYSRKCAKEQEKSGVLWGGWFQERDWKHWQAHMEKLIGRMDELLTREGETVALWTGSICQKVEPGKMAGKKEGEERENPHRSEEESMTFFERELKKMFGTGASFSEPRFVGNCCYGRLTDQIRVKINFQTGMVADHYDRLKVTLLNRNEGTIDSMVVKFGDVWGLKKTTNPNFRDGVNPHIWSYGKEIGWYVYQPGKEDYKVLSEAIKTYLQVFQEPEETMQMGQKMC